MSGVNVLRRAVLSACMALAAGMPAGQALAANAASGLPDLTGKWINSTPLVGLKTVEGEVPPLSPKGSEVYAAHKAHPDADPIKLCQLQGEPRLLYSSYPFLILQYSKHVDFIHETNHIFRFVNFDAKLDPDADPMWLGNSSARWEGKTLVIDSKAFNDKTWLDYKGLPHGEKLSTQERYTLSADGQTINGVVVIDDPEYYSRSWSTAFTLKKLPGFNMQEWICEDNHKM